MPNIDVTDGMFSWVDLMSTDTEASQTFYGALFGWTSEDFPTDQGSPYTMFRKGETDVAGMGS